MIDADDPMSLLTSILKKISEEPIPKTSAVPKWFNKPWFSNIYRDALKEQIRALKRFKRDPSEDNLNAYHIARAKARRDIQHSKKTSWWNYVSNMNSQTSVKSVWHRIRKIKGKESCNVIRHLSVNDRDITGHGDIANVLADTFSCNSSSAFSTDAFTSVRHKAENLNLNFMPLSIQGLQDALRRANDTSAGPYEIHYQLLNHLLLQNIFNKIWIFCYFPSDWKKAILIPIQNHGKDPTTPTKYRPIALTSCICKTMERMINRRLVWYLESHNLLIIVQCGFRSRRCTIDLLRFAGKLSYIINTLFQWGVLFGESLWYLMEVLNFRRSLWLWPKRSTSDFYFKCFKR